MTDREGGDSSLPVRLKSLSLRAFRNYESLNLELNPGMTLVVGQNGHGKTNMMEAVYFLCLGRSFRERREKRLIMFGSQSCKLQGEFEWDQRSHTTDITLKRDGPKVASLDGKEILKLSELVGKAPVVSLTVEDGRIIRGEPWARRKFLDVALAQADRGYLDALKKYKRALKQRNISLREGRKTLIESYEEILAESGTVIRTKRAGLIDFLAAHTDEAYKSINQQGEKFTISYRPNPQDDVEKKEILTRALAGIRSTDQERGFTSVGPHRDDVRLEVNNQNLRLYGSHGQARTALATMKLAELRYYTDRYNRSPILIMDEVASVLDRMRAENLIEILAGSNSQVFITSPGEGDIGPVAAKADSVIVIQSGKAKTGQ